MKIWIDILTPKQALFFKGVADELRERGYDIFITLREYRETIYLYNKYIKGQYRSYIVGRYGGASLINKLEASIDRMKGLIDIVSGEKPQASISFTSPDAARVAYGLGIKHISVSDSPHAEAASRLAVPLSIRLYTPWIIHVRNWTKYGISRDRVISYKGLDPIVWIRRHIDDRDTIETIVNRVGEKYIVIRPIEWMASYQLNTSLRRGMDIERLAKIIRREKPDLGIVILPRYSEDVEKYKKIEEELDNVTVPTEPLHGPTLVKYSNGLIGYGGTMTMESALQGKLTISMRPGRLPICIQYLVKRGLVKRARSTKEVIKILERPPETHREEALRIASQMEDPAVKIADTIGEAIENS